MDFTCHMRRSIIFTGQAADNGNYLESGEVRGNMLTRWFVFVPPCGASASFIGEKDIFFKCPVTTAKCPDTTSFLPFHQYLPIK